MECVHSWGKNERLQLYQARGYRYSDMRFRLGQILAS